MNTPMQAPDVVTALKANQSDDELAKVRKRLTAGEEAYGVRMRALFDIAKAHTGLPLTEVQQLLAYSAYEARMAAFCILDFKARARRITRDERKALYECYLNNHDRITTWDMVDRAAPRVVGGYLKGDTLDPLRALASSGDPLRRRTAITAPLYFVQAGSDADVAGGYTIAELLVADPDPVVHKPVGIFLKYAGERDAASLHRFLESYAATMPRAALRLAIEKLNGDERARYLA